MNDNTDKSLTYRGAGVDIDAGEALVQAIKPIAARTRRQGWLDALGGFGGLFELPMGRYQEPVLVSGTDGVGTKLKLALDLDKHDTIGIDLVAMCVNDILVSGAEPLFFLDYFATGKLYPGRAEEVISGIGRGCELAGAALIGGETAEMPGMYPEGEYDLAGFCVGVVEKSKVITGQKISPGDQIIGIASSGPHSNGYSLIRQVIHHSGVNLEKPLDEQHPIETLGSALLAPTRIYVKSVTALTKALPVHGLVHITGGGLPDNLPRILPDNTRAVIDPSRWARPPLFDWLQEQGNIVDNEMYRTFNCGVGMVAIIPKESAAEAISVLNQAGETASLIGEVENHSGQSEVVIL